MDRALDILKQYYGYSSFREGQENIIREILNGNDVLTIMPTGGGKSICYQVPAMLLDGITIVISPLISLMKDQVDNINNLGIKSAYINSSLNNIEINNILDEAAKNEIKILSCLMKNKGVIVSRDELMDYLWSSDMFVDENTLSVNVARLRKKLEFIGFKDAIETKRGIGYILL